MGLRRFVLGAKGFETGFLQQKKPSTTGSSFPKTFAGIPATPFRARSFPEEHALPYFHGLQPPARLCSKYSCAHFHFQTILQLGLKPVPAAAREQSRKGTEKPASKAGGAAPLPPAPPGAVLQRILFPVAFSGEILKPNFLLPHGSPPLKPWWKFHPERPAGLAGAGREPGGRRTPGTRTQN